MGNRGCVKHICCKSNTDWRPLHLLVESVRTNFVNIYQRQNRLFVIAREKIVCNVPSPGV